jgi:uncharacterized membrane protein YkoI
MMKALFALAAAVALAGAAPAAPSGHGEPAKKADRKLLEQQEIREAVRKKELLPLPRILAIAQAKVPGEVIKVELERKDWGLEYEVKLLAPSGRVREVDLNARTGAVMKIEDD